MITTRRELKEYLRADNSWYCPVKWKDRIIDRIAQYPWNAVKRYMFF